jgi:biotin carboxyl carrier protein
MKHYRFKINGNRYEVDVNSVEGDIATVTVNGIEYQVELENTPVNQEDTLYATPAAAIPRTPSSPEEYHKPVAAGGKAVTSPLPGVIIDIKVNIGDKVKAGQEVAVLEAMKMENSIEADMEGTVTAIHVNKGDSILEGDPIVTIG